LPFIVLLLIPSREFPKPNQATTPTNMCCAGRLQTHDKTRLWDARQLLSERLNEFRLRLHQGKTQLRPCDHGLKFLGFKLERCGRCLQQTGIRRFNQRLRSLQREFADGRINANAIGRSLQAWLAHVRDANTTGLRRVLWRRIRFQRRHER
jgi:hypothetical protein